MRERPHMGANIKGPYTTSIPAHAVTVGQQIIVGAVYVTVERTYWGSKVDKAKGVLRHTGCAINGMAFDFNEPIRVVVGSNTRGGMG